MSRNSAAKLQRKKPTFYANTVCNSCKTLQEASKIPDFRIFTKLHGLLFSEKNFGDARISNKRQSNPDSCQVFLRQ